MIDQDLKKKIVNTISRYEAKCDKLQTQINTLKGVIHKLSSTPVHNDQVIDEHYAELRMQIDSDFDAKAIESKLTRLVGIISDTQKKKKKNQETLSKLLKKGTEPLGRIANKDKDKKALSKLQKMIQTESDSNIVLVEFNEVLTQCVSSITKDMTDHQERLKQVSDVPESHEVNLQVNDSLQELLNHLSIPPSLDGKKEHLQSVLENKIHSEELSTVIDSLTELVIDSFNVEQKRFKGFLEKLTNQLYDFDSFLKETTQSRKQASADSLKLENGIQDNIDQIKSHLDTSTSLEELANKISKNLDSMAERLKEYRIIEKNRNEEYQSQIEHLQDKLIESEKNAEEIQNILTFQKYRINHDSLTNLPNREAYEDRMREAFLRWKRDPKDLSIAIADLDHFKKINDSYGHLPGDKVLKKVASIFKINIRDIDFISRIGGEEFVFIFENTKSKDAYKVLEKLRKSVKECQFYHKDIKVEVTVSFGLTTAVEGDDIESLFMRADNALYNAKKAGRNRVEVAT